MDIGISFYLEIQFFGFLGHMKNPASLLLYNEFDIAWSSERMNEQKTYSREHKCKIFFRNSRKHIQENIMFYDKIRNVFLVVAYLDLAFVLSSEIELAVLAIWIILVTVLCYVQSDYAYTLGSMLITASSLL